MLLNPQALYKAIEGDWHYIGEPDDLTTQSIHGNCVCNPDQLILVGERVTDGRDKCVIWQGQCHHCDRVYWTCDTWTWVSWLSDEQIVTMLPVRKLAVPGGVMIERTTMVFNDGTLEKVI